jgi:hypothetical protein
MIYNPDQVRHMMYYLFDREETVFKFAISYLHEYKVMEFFQDLLKIVADKDETIFVWNIGTPDRLEYNAWDEDHHHGAPYARINGTVEIKPQQIAAIHAILNGQTRKAALEEQRGLEELEFQNRVNSRLRNVLSFGRDMRASELRRPK